MAIPLSNLKIGSGAGGLLAGTTTPVGLTITAINNRSTIFKATTTTLAGLMLPVLFVVMLPGLAFGDLSTNIGALNDNSIISQNILAANQAIVEVLQECHDEVLSQIDDAVSALPDDDTSVINDPYASLITVNANQLIAQFCASKNKYNEINVTTLQQMIRENKTGLFSYEVSQQSMTTQVPTETDATSDSDSQDTEPLNYTQHTYTVKYAGDSYFADQVFHLTDDQKELASQYAENLSLFFGIDSSGIAVANVSEAVLAYRSVVERLATQYGMNQYVELILAVMMQESAGQGTDVMQASASGYNTLYPEGITDAEYSIECGIQVLKYALNKAGCTGPTDLDRLKLGLQAYNFGSAYIDYAMERDGGFTKENAVSFSEMMCARPNWPYDVYGDPEYVDHVLRYYSITSTAGTYPTTGMQIPHFLQTDYPNVPYGDSSLSECGCGPSSFSMIASYLTGTTITPADAVLWCGNSYYKPGTGTYWSYFQAAANHFGCGNVVQTTDANAVLTALSNGQPVISSQGPGIFTSGGHFIVLRGITASGKVLVNDPYDSNYKFINREFDMASEIHATSNAYWIFKAK